MKIIRGGIFPKPATSRFYLVLLVASLLGACGGIRFSQESPEAKDFHPRSIILISIDAGGHENAADAVDEIITGALTDRKWFQKVLSARQFQELCKGNEALRNAANDYLAKLKAVNFSDADLSRKISQLAGADALLVANLDYWYYTKEQDKNIAKVGVSFKLFDAHTGTMIWKAGHDLAVDYVFMKPELSSVAGDVVHQLVGYMPH